MSPPNRLIHQSSPYLLQHADNPVDWWPWCDDAFEEARRRDVPVFLSIGYAACHWCHVMERESFRDPAVARLLNERFVPVKVDREERPDVDELYMTATQLMTGSGGWPLSAFLDPHHRRPFWCGTYLPPEPRHNLPSFIDVLTHIDAAWRSRRSDVLAQARAVADAVAQADPAPSSHVALSARHVADAVADLLRTWDPEHGGFGTAPKFPQPVLLDFLLDARTDADPDTARTIDDALRTTLDRMTTGGLFDHLAGGFHRYCVDREWTVPHFEKMLYDNALLAATCARAADAFADPWYARTAERTRRFITNRMALAGGGFASSVDADTDHREGATYLWTPDQIRDALAPEDADLAIRCFGLDRPPNFRDPHHPHAPPAHVLRLMDRPDRLAARLGIEPAALLLRLDAIADALLRARDRRPQPGVDDKAVTAWNAMAIAALAEAHARTGDADPLHAARRAVSFLRTTVAHPDRPLLRSWREATPGPPAVLEDAAHLVRAFVALGRLGEPGALDDAARIARDALDRFTTDGLIFDAPTDRADLFVRPRSTYDGATPSGASTLLHALIDLSDATGDPAWRDTAARLIQGLSPRIAGAPRSVIGAVHALLRLIRAGALPDDPARAAPDPTPPRQSATTPEHFPVEIFADTDAIAPTPDSPTVFTLLLRIAPDCTVTAADPGSPAAVPFRIDRVSGQGVAVYADYPPGTPSPHDPQHLVYTGQVQIPVVVERTGPLVGTVRLGATVQVCTASACLAPVTVPIDVAVR